MASALVTLLAFASTWAFFAFAFSVFGIGWRGIDLLPFGRDELLLDVGREVRIVAVLVVVHQKLTQLLPQPAEGPLVAVPSTFFHGLDDTRKLRPFAKLLEGPVEQKPVCRLLFRRNLLQHRVDRVYKHLHLLEPESLQLYRDQVCL